MKRVLCAFLSVIMIASAFFCVDLSAYSSDSGNSYFNQLADGSESEHALLHINDEIDTLFSYVISTVCSNSDALSQYIYDYDYQNPTYDFMALISGSLTESLAGPANIGAVIKNNNQSFVPFDEVYYSYLNELSYNNCNFWTLYQIASNDWSNNEEVKNFSDELLVNLQTNLDLYEQYNRETENNYYLFSDIATTIATLFPDVWVLGSAEEAKLLVSDTGITLEDYEKSNDISPFISYVENVMGIYNNTSEVSFEEAVYYTFSNPLVLIYPVYNSAGSVEGYYDYDEFAQSVDNSLINAFDVFKVSDTGYYTDFQKAFVEGILDTAQIAPKSSIYASKTFLTEEDMSCLKDIFVSHITKTATIAAINTSDVSEIIKYYFNNYITNDAYNDLNTDFEEWNVGDEYTTSIRAFADEIEYEIYYPYMISCYFEKESRGLNLFSLFEEYGRYYTFSLREKLVNSLLFDHKFDLDLKSSQSEWIWINISNELLNELIDRYFNNGIGIINIKDIVNSMLSVDLDISNIATDIYLRFAQAPAATIFEVLPAALTILDDVLIPLLFNSENDAYYGFLNKILMGSDNGILYEFSQQSGSTIGIGQIGWDLNKVLPDILDCITGEKDIYDFETYSGVYDSSIPIITNIYFIDELIVNIKHSIDANNDPVLKNLLNICKQTVDEYVNSSYINEFKSDRNDKVLCSGLNNIFVFLPEILDILENNFADYINLDRTAWSYTDTDTIVVNSDASSENGFLKILKNTASNAEADETLDSLSVWIASVLSKVVLYADTLVTNQNDLSGSAPIIFNIINCFDIFGETSPAVFGLNNAFDLNGKSSEFSFLNVSKNTVLFVLSNIEKIISMIRCGIESGGVSESEPVSVTDGQLSNIEEVQNNTAIKSELSMTTEEIIALADSSLEDILYSVAETVAENFSSDFINTYFDILKNRNFTKETLNQFITEIYVFAEEFVNTQIPFPGEELNEFIQKLITGMFSPNAVAACLENKDVSAQLEQYNSWQKLQDSGQVIDWGMTSQTDVGFFNAVCNTFPRLQKVANVIVNDTDLYSVYLSAFYEKFGISLAVETLDSSLSKIITPILIGLNKIIDQGIFSYLLVDFENIEYFGYNIDFINDFFKEITDLTANEFVKLAALLIPGFEAQLPTMVAESDDYFRALSDSMKELFIQVASYEDIPELENIGLKPNYYDIDISGLSKNEIYETLFCNHEYIINTVAPTCTENGYVEYTCSKCGDYYYEDLWSTGHDYVDGICVNCEKSFLSEDGLYSYVVYDYSRILITGYFGNEKDITIPSSIDGHTVYGIGCPSSFITGSDGNSFANNNSLETIVVSEGIEVIGVHAFGDCYNLKSIELPESITSIYQQAFINCSSLEKIILPSNCKLIPEYYDDFIVTTATFEECFNLKEIYIPLSVTEIPVGTFDGCDSLTDIYYDGTEAEWNKIIINQGNDCLTNATIHFSGHTHTYDSGTILTDVTCSRNGYIKYTCTECGESYIETIPSPGHDFVNHVCANCGCTIDPIKLYETKTTVISKSDEYKYFEFVPESSGNYTFFSESTYDIEGVVYNSDMERLAYDSLSIGTSGFSVTYNFEVGKTYYLATGFSDDSTGSFDVTLCNHEYDENNARVIDPTCAGAGYTQNICVHCGHIQKSDYVAALNHDYKVTENVEPSCEKAGHTSYICTVCGGEYTEYKNPLNHYFINGACEKCGEIVQTIALSETKEIEISLPGDYKYLAFVPFESGEYSFISESNGYTFANLYNSEMDSMVSSNSSGTASGFSVSYNLEAGETYYLETGYRYDDSTGIFNVVINKNCAHNYMSSIVEPTCTVNGYTEHTCTLCRNSYRDNYISATGHKWDNGIITTQPTCYSTGLKTYTCENCNSTKTEIVDMIPHAYMAVVTQPTCTNQGYTTYICKYCEDSFISDYTAPLGHTEVIDEAIEPTCIATGLTEGKHCSRCNEILVEQEIVNSLGHSFTDYASDENATCTEDGTKTAKCDRCDVTDTVTDKGSSLGHIEVIDEAIAPFCTEIGLTEGKHCSRCNEILVEQETIDVLGHNWGNGIITKESSCTETGIKTYTCSRCLQTKTETIDKTEHIYTPTVVEPTCTEKGYTIYVCDTCSTNYISDYVDALGHDYSDEWTIDKEATCTADGSKSHHCSRCESKADVTVVEATGHSFGKWQTRKAATCTESGIDYKSCSKCGAEETLVTQSLGHNYESWTVTKEATVLCEGREESVCTRCSKVEVRYIDRIQVDINETEEYGLTNFTVVNAQTKEPIENANIFISTENDGENTFFTDKYGKVSVILPVGQQLISVYAERCLTRNLKITVNSGTNEIPLIGLSDQPTYEAEITHHLMSDEEIEEAGIDTSAQDNQHIYKYELKLEFEPEIDWLSLCYFMGDNGEIIGGAGSGTGSSGSGNYSINWNNDTGDFGSGGHFVIKNSDGDDFSVYPVNEYFYLIIRGEVKWLKEMFDVEILIVNNSMTDTLENLTATLELPDGLSLATMMGEQQSLSQTIGTIEEGDLASVHWYVRGDTAGSYSLEANLTGVVMPFEEEINETFIAERSLQVWAGDALHLNFEFPNAAYYGEDYPIKITLTNVSDLPLYNVNHKIQIEQGMEIYYSDGTSTEKIETSHWESEGIDKFNPGDKIVIEVDVNIFFESEVIEHELEKLIGVIDGVEQFIKGFKAVKSALDIADGLVSAVNGAINGIDTFLKSSAEIGEKLSVINTLRSTIVDFQLKYSESGNATLDSAIKLANSGVSATLNVFNEDPEKWLSDASEEDIQDLIDKMESLGNNISQEPTEEDIKNFDIFDSLRTMVSAIPVMFALKNVIMAEDESNTTSIPWSYSSYNTGAHYFGVSDVGNYLTNISKAILAETYEETVPSYIQLIPGCDDPMNYDDIKREIIAVENEIKQFKAKDATGEVTFKAYIVKNDASQMRARSMARSNDASGFILNCDNETAVMENGVLTFTGDGMIEVTPTSLTGGTLYIEDSEGNMYTYDIKVVEQHTCSASEWNTVISPTEEYDGFAVKCCDVCGDILDIENLSADICEEHRFGEWVVDSNATFDCEGIKTRTCSVCGYEDVEFTEKNDISISESNDSALPNDAKLIITSDSSILDGIVYDVKLMQDETEIQPQGKVTINIRVPEEMDENACKVYRQESDGTYTNMNAVLQDDVFVFTTDRFGRFVVTTGDPSALEVLLGDVTEDGIVDAADAAMIQRYDAGLIDLTAKQLQAADVTGDGMVDAADAVKIQHYDVGLISSL